MKKLEILGVLVTLTSGLLALVNQYYDVFWSLEYAPEVLLVICCGGLVFYGLRLLTTKPKPKVSPAERRRLRYAGLAFAVLPPIVGLVFWATTMRLSPEDQKILDDHLRKARGYEAIRDKSRAIEEYEQARKKAPWRGSIKAKISELRSQ